MTPVRTLRRVAVALLASVAAGTGFAHDTDSVEEITRAAELGDAEAQFDLGFMYTIGFGDFDADRAEALRWYRRSAEQGFARAQSVLGSAYAHGHSLEQDFTQAATWCRLGAEQGDAEGHLCMALLYAGGCGVEQDYTESARWYRLAADQGEGQAQARLGDMYANGVLGTLWWYPVARLWYPVARWWWWRTTAAIRAMISPPVIPDALMTTGSSGTPTCMAGTITSADT